jgi:group I intron endonuclease
MGCLYQLTSPSGKSYIGISSKTAADRWSQHRYNANKEIKSRAATECRALYNAIRKYGARNFTVTVLFESDNWAELLEIEMTLIASLKTKKPGGYNLTDGGEGTLGAIPSDIARQRMSEAQKRISEDPGMRAKRLAWLQGAVEKAAKVHRAMTPEQRAQHGRAVSAGYAKPGVRERVSAIHRKRFASPEAREELSVRFTGCKKPKWSDERKAAAAELRRREWADPEMRAKRLAGYKRFQESRA